MEIPYRDPEFLRQWSLAVLLYAKERSEERGGSAKVFEQWMEGLDQPSQFTLRELRSIFHDVREFAGGFNNADKTALAALLEAQFGAGSAVFKKSTRG